MEVGESVNGIRTCVVALATNLTRVLFATLLVIMSPGISAAEALNAIEALFQADGIDTHGHAFQRRAYCGHNLGRSFLDPEPRQPDVLTVGDTEDSGYNAVIGFDINRWLSTEINLAHLGSATIDRVEPGNEQAGVDQISYQLLDISAVAYLFNFRGGFANKQEHPGLFCRQSLSVYTRLGLGVMRNEAELDRVDHGRRYESHVTTGLGLEYGFINGLAVRAEYIRFDTDARFASVGLIARFGETRCSEGSALGNLPAPLPAVSRIPEQANPASLESPLEESVAVEKIQIDPLEQFDNYFDVDKDSLSAEAKAELTRFAEAIRGTEQQVYVAGHADGIGDSDYNLDLSVRRVDAVRTFLESQGIDLSRIEFEGFGENQPIDSNATVDGRARNRRVEIRVR